MTTAPSRWLLTALAGVGLVFVGGLLTAGGSTDGLVLIVAGSVGFVVVRVSSVARRRPVRAAGIPRQRAAVIPRQRAASVPVRQGRAPAPGGGRPRRR